MRKYDVVVVGGGPGGVCAAIAASRGGARTLLVERYAFLGGMATAGLVNPFMGFWAGGKPVVRGIFAEVLSALKAEGALGGAGLTFDEEILKLVLDDAVGRAGCEILFHSTLTGCSVKGGVLESVQLVSKGGVFEVGADVFIDGTGDADLAAFAGAKIEVGRDSDHLCQPMTLCFRVAGIDPTRVEQLARTRKILTDAYLAAKAAGEIDNPREDILVFPTLRRDVLHFNTTRITGKSPLDPADLTAAELAARRQVGQLVALFRLSVPGFENSYLEKMGMLTGVRESRRVIGEYVLSVDDVVHAAKLPDAIACSTYPVDIHNPAGTGTVITPVPEGDWYEIPYRCIVPLGLANLLMAGRSISATHEAHSSLRVMPVVAAIGQAAGAAAAMAALLRIGPSELDIGKLRTALRQAGAFVGEAP